MRQFVFSACQKIRKPSPVRTGGRLHLFLSLIFLSCGLSAQEPQSSKTYIQTCYNGQQCFSLNSSSFIFYNPDNHELIIEVDFKKFKTGNDTLDQWLEDLDDSKLVFRGLLQTENLMSLTQHNSKALSVKGNMTFNGVTHAHEVLFTLFEIPRESLMFVERQNDYFDRINANIQFGFSPKEFKIHKKPHHLKKKITLAIYRGYVNPIRSGVGELIGR